MGQEVRLKQIRSDIRRGKRARFFLWIKVSFLTFVLMSVFAVFFYFNYWHADFDEKLVDDFLNFKPPLTTEILDRNGKILIELEGVKNWSVPFADRAPEYRHWVKYEEIPEVMIQALLAAEDKYYFDHNGIDFWGLVRAAGENVIESAKETRRRGKFTLVFAQGASTASQQATVLSKLAEDDAKRSRLASKIRKMRMAIWLEKTLTKRLGRAEAKKRIFEVFANTSYCSEGRYGIYDGFKLFFGRELKGITRDDIPYAVTVAETFRSPKRYSPYNKPREALNRRNGILAMMAKHNVITKEELEKFKEYPLGVIPIVKKVKTEAPGAVRYIMKNLWSKDKNSLIWENGVTVKSSIDLDVQRMANNAVEYGLNLYKERQLRHAADPKNSEFAEIYKMRAESAEGALVVIENKSGNVLAMVGGRNNDYTSFDRAVEAMRQPGSAFKTFVYGTAIQEGRSAWKIDCLREGTGKCKVYDGRGMRVSMGRNKAPHPIGNYTNEFFGWIPPWYAFAKSQNSAAMWLAKQLGVPAIMNFLSMFGLNKKIESYPTTMIGAEEVTVLEFTAAYSVFPSDGIYYAPRIIWEVKDHEGNISVPETEVRPILIKFIADEMVELLRHTVLYKGGTGRGLNTPDFHVPFAGKTGTTNDFNDAWFCGSNPEITMCAWVGMDNSTPLGGDLRECKPLHPREKEHCESGGKTALPIAKNFLSAYYKNKTPPQFPVEMEERIKYTHEHDKHPKR